MKVQTRAISPYVKKRNLWKEIFKNKEIYLLALPAVIWYIVFSYMPMGGLTLAFKSFKAKLGIWGSPWVGWTHFESLFQDPAFARSVGITLWINLVELLLCFPAPILLALMLNELRLGRYKKILQTVFTFPHFLSWVIIGSIVKNLFSIDGVINGLMAGLGMDKVSFLGNKDFFRPLLYCSEIWKEAGWSSIIYLAAISGVDPEQMCIRDRTIPYSVLVRKTFCISYAAFSSVMPTDEFCFGITFILPHHSAAINLFYFSFGSAPSNPRALPSGLASPFSFAVS